MERLLNQKKYFVILIIVSAFGITYLHYSTLPGIHDLHNIFAELYYMPLLLGALAFGLKGAVLTFIFVTALYAPYVLVNWEGTYLFISNKLLHALFSGSFAILAGYLIDREKMYREQVEKDRYLAGLGQAAAAIVHDLKNPLITILGFAKRIQRRKGNIDTTTQSIMDSAQDMQLIVHDVLDFAKPIRLEMEKADFGDVVNKACDACRTRADEKSVNLSVHQGAEQVNIFIDRSQMKRALINLINNAIDASNRWGQVVICTEIEMNYVYIKIKDYGEGIDKETLENVFTPFFTKKNSGTGLGMAIAKKIIEEHEGKIYINSQERRGSEVIVELPMQPFSDHSHAAIRAIQYS